MNVSYEEIGSLNVSFPAGDCEEYQVCKIGASASADQCSPGDRFCGKVLKKGTSVANVQLHGFAKVYFSGSAPAPGYAKLVADGFGGVKTNESGYPYLVVDVDNENGTLTIEL